MASFEIKKTYNFSIQTDAAAVLGAEYSLMKVRAIMNSEEAAKKADVTTTYNTIKGVLTDLPESITDLTFILFENTDGNTTVLALEYIDTDTIEEVESVNIRVNILNASTEDISILTTAVKELGYTNFTVTTFE